MSEGALFTEAHARCQQHSVAPPIGRHVNGCAHCKIGAGPSGIDGRGGQDDAIGAIGRGQDETVVRQGSDGTVHAHEAAMHQHLARHDLVPANDIAVYGDIVAYHDIGCAQRMGALGEDGLGEQPHGFSPSRHLDVPGSTADRRH